MTEKQADLTVENHGSIFLFRPHTERAREWIEEHVPEPTWFGDALAVEHGYAHDLADGMIDDGLILE